MWRPCTVEVILQHRGPFVILCFLSKGHTLPCYFSSLLTMASHGSLLVFESMILESSIVQSVNFKIHSFSWFSEETHLILSHHVAFLSTHWWPPFCSVLLYLFSIKISIAFPLWKIVSSLIFTEPFRRYTSRLHWVILSLHLITTFCEIVGP